MSRSTCQRSYVGTTSSIRRSCRTVISGYLAILSSDRFRRRECSFMRSAELGKHMHDSGHSTDGRAAGDSRASGRGVAPAGRNVGFQRRHRREGGRRPVRRRQRGPQPASERADERLGFVDARGPATRLTDGAANADPGRRVADSPVGLAAWISLITTHASLELTRASLTESLEGLSATTFSTTPDRRMTNTGVLEGVSNAQDRRKG